MCGVAIALIGYWRSTREPDWPDPQDFVDDSWDPEERDLVARYLESGASPPWMQCGPSWCRICSSDPLERIDQDRMNQAERVRSSGDFNGTGEWTDGVYLWPEGLSHYVREHAVHLPVVIIEHIRRGGSSVEDPDRIRYGDVDWEWWKSAQPDWKSPD